MITIGIDIGVTGALTAIDSYGSCQIADIPTVDIPGKRMVRRRINARGLLDLIRGFVPIGEKALVLIEDIHTMPSARNSPQSQGSLMHSLGVVQTVIELARHELTSVSPQTWKRHYGLIGKTKTDGLVIARTLYPGQVHMLKRVMDHNRADSLLLAHYGAGGVV